MIGSEGKIIRKFDASRHIVVLILLTISLTVIPCLAADQFAFAKDLTYITEQFPPYNFQEGGKLQGISVDLLEMMWEGMGVNLNRSVIEILPWTEGYQRALDKKNTVLFSTARLPQREQLFKWAGPIGPIRNVLLIKKDKNINISSAEGGFLFTLV